MPADIVEIRPPTDTRPAHDRAFQAAVAALRAIVEARDAAVEALDEFAEALVRDVETYEETLALPLSEILARHSAQTIALWQHIGFVKANLDDRGDVFDVLTRLDVPELEQAFAALRRANGLEEAGGDA